MVMKEQRYICTPFMGRTAYTQPQCLYKGALYLYLVIRGEHFVETDKLWHAV